MSIPVFLRNPDGTAWEGRIAYNFVALRESNYELKTCDITNKSTDEIYDLYGSCPALQITNTATLKNAYKFTYGYSLEELIETTPPTSNYSIGSWKYTPIEWTIQTVKSMDWDAFCYAYYAFLCSATDFESKFWKVLDFILNTLRNNTDILTSLLLKYGRDNSTQSCNEFWDTIYRGIETKVLNWMTESWCYKAYCALTVLRRLFSSEEKYLILDKQCCDLFDRLAIKRIDDACSNTYTVKELTSFNIETYFFYNDYFTLSENEKTKRYVMNSVFAFLHTKGDKIVNSSDYLGADLVYESALKFAQSDSDKNLIEFKRSKIKNEVAKINKKKENAKRKDKATDVFAKVMAYALIISLLVMVIFGLLFILGIFKPFSKLMLTISFIIFVPTVIFALIGALQEKLNKR